MAGVTSVRHGHSIARAAQGVPPTPFPLLSPWNPGIGARKMLPPTWISIIAARRRKIQALGRTRQGDDGGNPCRPSAARALC
jgi:hypothetical protein